MILMTAENPSGWKLEELLQQLQQELAAKTRKLDAWGDHRTAKSYRESNKHIIEMLADCENRQRQALRYAEQNPLPPAKG